MDNNTGYLNNDDHDYDSYNSSTYPGLDLYPDLYPDIYSNAQPSVPIPAPALVPPVSNQVPVPPSLSLQPRLQSLQQQPNYTLWAIVAAVVTGGAYAAYKYWWVPYNLKKEQESCIEACYAKTATKT